MTNKAALKTITEDAVIREVKTVIELTGLAIQRINTGAFAIGTGKVRRFIRTANKGT
ncbi:VRR-NUC domain-containing protein, partial [Treponema vincentii]